MAGRGVGGADPASRMAYVVKSGDGEQYWVRGNLFGFKASTREVGHGFAVVETTLHPVAAAPAHVHHETDEGVFMIQGRMLVDVGEQRLDLSAGDFAFLPRDIPHRYLPQEPGPVRTLWILSPEATRTTGEIWESRFSGARSHRPRLRPTPTTWRDWQPSTRQRSCPRTCLTVSASAEHAIGRRPIWSRGLTRNSSREAVTDIRDGRCWRRPAAARLYGR